jgi:predicted DNA-binding protein
MSSAPISVRLPKNINTILDALAGELHTTKTKLIKNAIIERIEDYLDSKAIDDALSNSSKTYTLAEMKVRHGLES